MYNKQTKNRGIMNANTIKSQVKKDFPGIEVIEVKKFKFGMFSIKVKKQMKRSVKIGNIFGETDFDKSENGVVLDPKISWS